jgi:hypothetical protein
VTKLKQVIAVNPAGDMTFVSDEALNGLMRSGEATIRRASHVEPANTFKRVLFQILRGWAGDVGTIARWTRRWKGCWRVNLVPSDGPILGPFANRQEAIRREVEWLNDQLAGTQKGENCDVGRHRLCDRQ